MQYQSFHFPFSKFPLFVCCFLNRSLSNLLETLTQHRSMLIITSTNVKHFSVKILKLIFSSSASSSMARRLKSPKNTQISNNPMHYCHSVRSHLRANVNARLQTVMSFVLFCYASHDQNFTQLLAVGII